MPTPREIVEPTHVCGKRILTEKGFTVTTAKGEPRVFTSYKAAVVYARDKGGRITFYVEPTDAD
jgi:hypothetical protein